VRAVVIDRPNAIDWREVPEPACGPDDVLIRSHGAGLCRTDLDVLGGRVPEHWVRYPCIPGHEWSGTIAEVGSNVSDLELGARVVAEGVVPCNRCRRCKAGDTNLCVNYQQLGFTRPGGCAEMVAAPRHIVHPLRDHTSLDAAVLVEPASCVYRGLERADPRPGDAVGVIGIGTLGSIALQLAALWHPRALIAYGVRPEELQFARTLGADHAVRVDQVDPEEATRDLLGDGCDVVIETAGQPAAVDAATRVARYGGGVALLGIAGAGRMLELPADRFMVKDLRVVGSFSYTSRAWSIVTGLVADELVDFERLVTHRFPTPQYAQALDLLDHREGTVVKILLEHARPPTS
jgi:L-iditol 2-dehydrogenase